MRQIIAEDRACLTAPTMSLPRDGSLCEALDRVLDTGAVVDGNLTVSVADVDLLYLDLRLLLASFETARHAGAVFSHGSGRPSSCIPLLNGLPPPSDPPRLPTLPDTLIPDIHNPDRAESPVESVAPAPPMSAPPPVTTLGNGFAQLVLTLANLLHELLERQALRRMVGGSLSDREIERLGVALMRQSAEIDRLRDAFGLGREDLRLSLGTTGHTI